MFSALLRQTRERAGLTQEELAERADLHRTYIGGIERGERNVALINLVKLARAFRVKPAELREHQDLWGAGADRGKALIWPDEARSEAAPSGR